METVKSWIIIIAGVVIIVLCLLRGCSDPFPQLDVKPEPQVIIKSDTIFSKDTIVKLKTIYKPKYDTIYKLDTIVDKQLLDSLLYVRIYNDSLSDSHQTIYSKIKVIGVLDKLDLSYKLHPHPTLITNNITKTEIVYEKPKATMYVGGIIGGGATSFHFGPSVILNINNTTISYSYETINKIHIVGVGIELFSLKK